MGPLTPTDLDAAAFVHQERGMLAQHFIFSGRIDRELLCKQKETCRLWSSFQACVGGGITTVCLSLLLLKPLVWRQSALHFALFTLMNQNMVREGHLNVAFTKWDPVC